MIMRYRRRSVWLALAVAITTTTFAQQPPELIIRNGLVATVDGRFESDVRIRGGAIAEIGRNLRATAGGREIEARGLLVIPGGFDPHVHIGGAENYTTGSAAALAGGITTLGSFANIQAGETAAAGLERAAKQVRSQAIADVILHSVIGDFSGKLGGADLSALVTQGQSSIKVFMNRPGFEQNIGGFLTLLRAAGSAGILTMMHCEDLFMLSQTTDRMLAEGRGSLQYFAESRPIVSEEVATARAVAMSEFANAPIYVVHLSSERALRAAEAGQARGLAVYVETRPVYLHFTQELYERPDRGLFIGQPPLHSKRDQDAMWDGLVKGTIQVLATDHNGFTKEQKLDPSQTVANHRAGIPNLQEMRPMLYSEGVRTKRMSLERFVAVTSTNPAKLFGLYPRKGTIAVGSDADVVIWDPNDTRTIRDEDMLSGTRWSAYSGWKVTGWPRITIRRGEIVYQGGKVTGAAGSGQLVRRDRWQRPALSLSKR